MLDEPTGVELPPKGFSVDDPGYQAPAADGSGVQVIVKSRFSAFAIAGAICCMGRYRPERVETADQSKRKMYYRPYLYGGSLVEIPWSPR